VHRLQPGQDVLVSLPRNLLPLVDCDHTILIAGGIGITPFMPMIHQMLRDDRSFELHYSYRHRSAAAFVDWLETHCPKQAVFHETGRSSRIDLKSILANLDQTTHVYCCGPQQMIDDVLRFGSAFRNRVHVESFGGQTDPSQKAYEIHLKRSGRKVTVAEGQTMLDALRAAEIDVPASCEGGICLECKTRYVEGSPTHRDITMPKSDRHEYLTPCVSGCASDHITLDL